MQNASLAVLRQSLPVSVLDSLTIVQEAKLVQLIQSPPPEVGALTAHSINDIQSLMRSIDSSIGLGSEIALTLFDRLLQSMQVVLSPLSRDTLIKAISRNPSRTVNIRLFLALIKHWQSAQTPTRCETKPIMSALLELFPEILSIVDSYCRHPNRNGMTILKGVDFTRIYPAYAYDTTSKKMSYLLNFGYMDSNDNVFLDKLASDVSKYRSGEVSSSPKKNPSLLVEIIHEKIVSVKRSLIAELQNCMLRHITKDQLFTILWNQSVMLSIPDYDAYWGFLTSDNPRDVMEVGAVLQYLENLNVKSSQDNLLSPMMARDQTQTNRQLKAVIGNQSGSKIVDRLTLSAKDFDHSNNRPAIGVCNNEFSPRNGGKNMQSLMTWEQSRVPKSEPSPQSASPWRFSNEMAQISNSKSKLLLRIGSFDVTTLKKFYMELSQLVKQSNNDLTRRAIQEALLLHDIRLLPSDCDNLWSEFCEFIGQSSPNVDSFFQWLGFESICQEVASKPTYRGYEDSSSLDRFVVNNVCESPKLNKNGSIFTFDSKSIANSKYPNTSDGYSHASNFQSNQDVLTPISLNFDRQFETNSSSSFSLTEFEQERNLAISQLQEKKSDLAMVFRRLCQRENNPSGFVLCRDLSQALSKPPLSLTISHENAWKLVCEIAKTNSVTTPRASQSALVSHESVLRYLENAKFGHNKPEFIDQIIRRKLTESKIICGNRLNLVGSITQLRNRLRLQLTRGQTASWDASPDSCSLLEFRKLMECLDVWLSDDEVSQLYRKTMMMKQECGGSGCSSDAATSASLASIGISDALTLMSQLL